VDDSTSSEPLRFDEPGTARAVVLDDDGRVAYAYLLKDEEVVGDVWLYNVDEAPETPPWKDPSQMPFLNPKSYCRLESVPRLQADSEVHCRWYKQGVEVSIDGIIVARLEEGAKPGWSRMAARPGPLAKPLESTT
jgi:hypothetical protein